MAYLAFDSEQYSSEVANLGLINLLQDSSKQAHTGIICACACCEDASRGSLHNPWHVLAHAHAHTHTPEYTLTKGKVNVSIYPLPFAAAGFYSWSPRPTRRLSLL